MRRLRIFLDANVIVDAQLRDLFLTAAELELVDVHWSESVMEEVDRVLQARLGLTADQVAGLRSAMLHAFPLASIDASRSELEAVIELPDPDDVHVLEAALLTECDLLITSNTRDFPEHAFPPGAEVAVVDPDTALLELAGLDPPGMASVVARVVSRLRSPAMTIEAFLERLERSAPLGTLALGTACGIEQYEKMFHDVAQSHSESSPFEAVRRLIDAIRANDVDGAVEQLAPQLRKRLTGSDDPTNERVFAELSDLLSDVLESDDWGFATASRPTGPNAELVKYLKVGNEAFIAKEPTLVEHSHLFWMELTDDQWIVVDLDGEDPGLGDYVTSQPT